MLLGCVKSTNGEATDAGVSVREVQWETEGDKGTCFGGQCPASELTLETPALLLLGCFGTWVYPT